MTDNKNHYFKYRRTGLESFFGTTRSPSRGLATPSRHPRLRGSRHPNKTLLWSLLQQPSCRCVLHALTDTWQSMFIKQQETSVSFLIDRSWREGGGGEVLHSSATEGLTEKSYIKAFSAHTQGHTHLTVSVGTTRRQVSHNHASMNRRPSYFKAGVGKLQSGGHVQSIKPFNLVCQT